jgi:transcriptional regulator of acetoin/glycerol metabolism
MEPFADCVCPQRFGRKRLERRVGRLGRASDERQRLIDAINQAGGKKSEAARLLGISRVTLWKLLKVHDIQVDKIIRG